MLCEVSSQFQILDSLKKPVQKPVFGKDKARYMIIYGIYPAFKQKLKSMISNSPWYFVSFDKSLKKKPTKEEFLIDNGAVAKDDLSKNKVATEKKRKFQGECKLFVVSLLLKLHQERFPIQYALVKNPSINPNNMTIQAVPMSKRFVCLADLLYSLKFISSFDADNAKFQYDQFTKKEKEVVREVDKEVDNEKDQFLSFDTRKQPADVFLRDYLSISLQYRELWSICKLIFILQHGQSFTERCFSVNKEIPAVNMQEDAFISQRLAYDHLLQIEKEVWEFPITPELRKSYKLAHQKKRLEDQ